MKPPLIIFDVDNTLIEIQNDADYFDSLLVDSINEMGLNAPERSQRNQLWASGSNYPLILQKWGVKDRFQLWAIFDRLDCQRRERMVQNGELPLIAGANAIIAEFKARGYKIAALSNSNASITNFLIEYHHLSPYFDYIQGLEPGKDPDEVKPETKGLLRVIEKCGYNSFNQRIFLIGDSWTDILVAKRVDIHSILFDPFNKASKLDLSPEELRNYPFTRIRNLSDLLTTSLFGNPFGSWDVDERGLPVFEYYADPYRSQNCKTFSTYGQIVDHMHLFGNSQWAAVAHNNGSVDLLDASNGFLWLTHDPSLHLPPEKQKTEKVQCFGGGITSLKTLNSVYYDILRPQNPAEIQEQASFCQYFGVNYYEKRCKLGPFHVRRRFEFPAGDQEYCISTITITNSSNQTLKANLKDFWNIYAYYLVRSLIVNFKNRKKYGETHLLNWAGNIIRTFQTIVGADTESARTRFAKKIQYTYFHEEISHKTAGNAINSYGYIGYHLDYQKKGKFSSNKLPSSIPPEFKSIFLLPLEKLKIIFESIPSKTAKSLSWETEIELMPNETKSFVCVVGYCEKEKITPLINEILTKLTFKL